MKSPSTGNFDPTGSDGPSKTGADHPTGSGKTSTRVNGENSPRLPHERDESTDTGTEAPSETMRIAHDDASSSRAPTDKSEEMDSAYSGLRNEVPGSERDVGAD